MKARLLLTFSVAMLTAPLAAQAQATTNAPAKSQRELATDRREAMQRRRDALQAMTPEQRAAARTQARERFNAMPIEQQQFLRDLRSYQRSLRDKSRELRGQVDAGTLTRDDMAQQLKAYRDANRPSRPASLPPRTPNP
jgi:Skp family chaperone for outer membrane proteins